ncbi:cytochrome P450 [Astrocystis sublimbata]|nr:cytochrome P450 [Astrocystis sublimbata]
MLQSLEGPNEVTLFGYSAYATVHGPDSRCGRAVYYNIMHPTVSIDSTRNPEVHAHRRKVWTPALSNKALQLVEEPVYGFADRLIRELRANIDKSVNISDYIEFFSFDVMGHIGLNLEFDSLTNHHHPILDLWHIAYAKLGCLNFAPWVKHLFMGIPYIERMKQYREFMDWAHEELDKNIKVITPILFDIPAENCLMSKVQCLPLLITMLVQNLLSNDFQKGLKLIMLPK